MTSISILPAGGFCSTPFPNQGQLLPRLGQRKPVPRTGIRFVPAPAALGCTNKSLHLFSGYIVTSIFRKSSCLGERNLKGTEEENRARWFIYEQVEFERCPVPAADWLLVKERSETSIQSPLLGFACRWGERQTTNASDVCVRVCTRTCACTRGVTCIFSWLWFSAQPRLTRLVVWTRVILLECKEQRSAIKGIERSKYYGKRKHAIEIPLKINNIKVIALLIQ